MKKQTNNRKGLTRQRLVERKHGLEVFFFVCLFGWLVGWLFVCLFVCLVGWMVVLVSFEDTKKQE